jgi:hypothetical protein
MSFLQGYAPVAYGQTISGGAPGQVGAFSDTDAVNTLLNFSGSRNFNSFANMSLGANTTNMLLTQSANKSLLVMYNQPSNDVPTDVTGPTIIASNAASTDVLGFNKTASTVLTTESYQMKSVSPNGGVVNNNDNTYSLSLTEIPTNQPNQDACNNLRILNNNVPNTNIAYNANNLSHALGQEGVAYFYNNATSYAPFYLNVSSYETLATNNITLTIATLNTLNATYNYELMKLSYDNPTFLINSTGAGASAIVDAFGTANLAAVNAQSSYSYLNFLQSYNYSGLMGATYTSVVTSDLNITLSNVANATQAFAYASGYADLVVNPTFVSINNITTLAQAQNMTFANTMNVTLAPSVATLNSTQGGQYNNTAYLVVSNQSELLPTGHAQDPLVLSFSSANRSTVTNSGNYSTSATVYYQADNNGAHTYLNMSAMTTTAPVINATLAAVPTVFGSLPNQGVNNQTSYNNGMFGIYPSNITGYSGFSVVNSTTANVNVIGKLTSATTMNFTGYNVSNVAYNSSKLPVLQGVSGGNYNSSNTSFSFTGSYLSLDPSTFNGIQGFGVLGGYVDSDAEMRMSSTGNWRLVLVPSNPIGTSSVSETHANVTITNGITAGYANNSSISYKVSYANNGPVIYNSFPDGNYYQTYTLDFPTPEELRTNKRVQRVKINGYDQNDVKLNANEYVIDTLTNGNFNYNSTNPISSTDGVSGITTFNYVLTVDLSLSGVKPFVASSSPAVNDGALVLNIPISYQIKQTLGVYSYVNGQPSITVKVLFNGDNLSTHQIRMQGETVLDPNGNTIPLQWADTYLYANNLGYDAVDFWSMDLREPVDVLGFDATSGNNTLYTFNFSLYPQITDVAPAFYNSYYVMPFSSTASGWTGRAWNLNNQANLQTAGFNGLDLNSIVAVANNNYGVSTALSVTSDVVGGVTSIYVSDPTSGVFSTFQFSQPLSGMTPLYFVYTNGTIIQALNNMGGSVYNSIAYSNQQAQIEPGVYITSPNITINGYGHAVGNSVATVALNKDTYAATAYTGQTGQAYNSAGPIPNISGATAVLIPTSIPGGTTDSILSQVVRGYPNGSTYVFNRSNVGVTVQFGAYSDSLYIVPVSQNTPTYVTINCGQNLGIKLVLNVNPTGSNQNTVFNANKTAVNVNYAGANYTSVPSASLQIIQLIAAVGTNVPWVERLFLNNFFVAGANSLDIHYQQAPVLISTAQYNTVNNSLNGRQAVESASYTLRQSVDDAAIKNASYVVVQDQETFGFNAAKMLRNQAKAFYITIAPVDLAVTYITGNSVNTSPFQATQYISLNSNTNTAVNIGVDGILATYKLVPNYNLSLLKSATPANSNFLFTNNLYSLQGSQNGGSSWTNYLTNADFSNAGSLPAGFTLTGPVNGIYNLAFLQTGFNQGSGDLVNLTFSSLFMRPLFNGAWSASINLTPATLSYLDQYELTFAVNNTSKLIQPVVTKYHSSSYPSNYLGATGTLNNPNGYYNNLQCNTAHVLNTQVSVAGLPYTQTFLNASQYPAVSGNATYTSTSWTQIATPSSIDLVYQVGNGTNGLNYYNQWMAVSPGNFVDCKLVSLFAKDQMVVQDYAGHLVMRVGPDGHLYTGDLSTFSVVMNDNQATSPPAINGLMVPIFNSGVGLNSGY